MLEYGRALPEAARSGSGDPVVGSAGIVGLHDPPTCEREEVIVVGRKGTAGSLHWIPGPCSPIDTTYWVRPVTADVDYAFLFLLLEELRLTRYTAETGVPGLNRDRVYEIQAALPPLPAQRRIVEVVAAADGQIVAYDRALTAAKNLRSSLLADLVSGRHAIPGSFDRFITRK